MSEQNIQQACSILRDGGVIAYPTEAVFGLGCDPRQERSILRLLEIKQRPMEKGLILVASDVSQLEHYIDIDSLAPQRWSEIQASWPGPVTWVVPTPSTTSQLLRGEFQTLAVRVSAHPVVQVLCQTFGAPIVSTSANLSGEPPMRTYEETEQQLGTMVDYIVRGQVGGAERPTEIRDALSDRLLRQ